MPNPPAQVLTVTDLTRRVKDLLEEKFPAVWVEGEISNFRSPSSGHVYFTLKDANAQLAVVLFRGVAAKTGFALKDGLQVIAFGDVSVYERSGQYQLVARQLLPKGLGALQLAFEELKQRLAKEGLFDAARKRKIPALPQHIGLVTSPTGAAIRDFLNIIGRRFPNVHIVINPVRVQGDGAGNEIAAAIDEFNSLHASHALTLDVLIVTRGGGSLEDLWAFNEEVVARALARSNIPTISAVGHEIDFTISDFVADLRAPTPSAAAELVVKAKDEFLHHLAQYQTRLQNDLRLQLAEARQRFSTLASVTCSAALPRPFDNTSSRSMIMPTDSAAPLLQPWPPVAPVAKRSPKSSGCSARKLFWSTGDSVLAPTTNAFKWLGPATNSPPTTAWPRPAPSWTSSAPMQRYNSVTASRPSPRPDASSAA